MCLEPKQCGLLQTSGHEVAYILTMSPLLSVGLQITSGRLSSKPCTHATLSQLGPGASTPGPPESLGVKH